jgi:hypothetical protein
MFEIDELDAKNWETVSGLMEALKPLGELAIANAEVFARLQLANLTGDHQGEIATWEQGGRNNEKMLSYAGELICKPLEVPRSTYYHAATPTSTQLSDQSMGKRIGFIFKTHRRRYGYRRIHCELSGKGITCAPARIRRLMQERGLKAILPRSYVRQDQFFYRAKSEKLLVLLQPSVRRKDAS